MDKYVPMDQDFNPHSRVGSDDKFDWLTGKIQISIHTPA